jgi:hypothetical protein
MEQTHASSNDPSIPQISTDVVEYVERYEPKLLAGIATPALISELKQLVLRCEPTSLVAARSMLATASRYLSDVCDKDADVNPFSCESGADLHLLLTDARVARWARCALQDGMPPQTLSNHIGRLRRFLRVRRGLPASMIATRESTRPTDPLSDTDRARLEDALLTDHHHLLPVYVAVVGAGLGPTHAKANRIDADNNAPGNVADKPLVADIEPLAAVVNGAVVGEDDWDLLRSVSQEMGVTFDAIIARNTHTLLALREPAPAATTITKHRITRRQIETIRTHLERLSPSQMADLLRG